ncbi:hypothetical protein GCM10010495_74430 [Kitasatospora herbaricolor]|nr:hypothetical protein GCM10010495_74430 [Kitasatospora herbaricolor]
MPALRAAARLGSHRGRPGADLAQGRCDHHPAVAAAPPEVAAAEVTSISNLSPKVLLITPDVITLPLVRLLA